MAEETIDLADPLDPNDVHAARQALQTVHEEAIASKQAWLRRRREAYVRVFSDKPIAGDAAIVLADLKQFCRGGQTPWHVDPRVHALLTGRFETYTRIDQHMHMTFDELWELLSEGKQS